MDKPRTSHAGVILAIAFLLLPLLYVGSYLAMLNPAGEYVVVHYGFGQRENHYRFAEPFCSRFFWPMEWIDRKFRPGAWKGA